MNLDILKKIAWYIFIGLLVVYSAAVGYWLFYPFNPIDIDSLTINKTEANVGDEVCIHMVGEKLMPLAVHVSIELMNGIGVAIMNYDSNNPVGTKFQQRCFNIPMHIGTSTYRVKWTGTYNINEFRRITKEVYSAPIHITNHWYRGIKGDTGAKGIQGIQGIQGKKGDKGNLTIFGTGK